MKKTITIFLFFLTSTCLFSQKVDFKKDLSPLIKAKNFSNDGATIAEKYIQQNYRPDGSLTESAILLNYNKVYSAKVYLANCLYIKGKETMDVKVLELALKHFKEASEFLTDDISGATEGKKKTESLINEIYEANDKANKLEAKRKEDILKQAEIERQKVIQDNLVLTQKIQSDSLAEIQKQNAAEKQKTEDDFIKNYNTSLKSNPSLYTNQSAAVSCVKSFMTYAGDGNISGMKSVCEKLEDNEKRKEVGSYGVLRILGVYDRDPIKAKNEFAKIKSSSLKNPAVYYFSSSTAMVLASKWGTDPYAKGFYFYVGKIGSSWKILGMDDTVFLRGNTLSLDQKQLIEKTLMKKAVETN
jgi:hypothetical protein